MSKVLENLKPEITRSRTLSYFGKYTESVLEFNKLIPKIESEIFAITDKNLNAEWNKLLE